MKQMIVILAMMALGIIIFGMIAGPGENSLLSTMSDIWKQELESQKREP